MARIAGVDIPREKRLVISLTYVFGVGATTAALICKETGVDPDTRVLLQVTLDDAAAADEIFAVLMGEDVESRRSFIQKNARDVRFLDI